MIKSFTINPSIKNTFQVNYLPLGDEGNTLLKGQNQTANKLSGFTNLT
jgi:hypothetical protein